MRIWALRKTVALQGTHIQMWVQIGVHTRIHTPTCTIMGTHTCPCAHTNTDTGTIITLHYIHLIKKKKMKQYGAKYAFP